MSHYVFSVNELGLGISWTYPSKIGRCWRRPGGYVAFYDLALLGRDLCLIEIIETNLPSVRPPPNTPQYPSHYAYDTMPRTLAHLFYLPGLASP